MNIYIYFFWPRVLVDEETSDKIFVKKWDIWGVDLVPFWGSARWALRIERLCFIFQFIVVSTAFRSFFGEVVAEVFLWVWLCVQELRDFLAHVALLSSEYGVFLSNIFKWELALYQQFSGMPAKESSKYEVHFQCMVCFLSRWLLLFFFSCKYRHYLLLFVCKRSYVDF